MITNKDRIWVNKNNFNANLVQLLVQNYLYDKYDKQEVRVYIYDELINDIDIFDKQLDITNKNIIIDAFFSYLDENDITFYESIDVKFANDLLMKNIKQILTKCIYPNNTKLKLIFVPSIEFDKRDYLKEVINTFTEYKDIIINKLDNTQRERLVNNIVNITNYDNFNINDALYEFIEKLLTNKDRTTFKQNVSIKDVEVFINNLNNFTIEIIEKEQLLSVPIHKELIGEIISCPIPNVSKQFTKQLSTINKLLNKDNNK